MLYQNIPSNIGKDEIETERSAGCNVIEFLDRHLPKFPADFRLQTTKPRTENENSITQMLCSFLERIARIEEWFMIHFQYQYPDAPHSSDIGVIDATPQASIQPILLIEAKRLPADRKSREKEYVATDAGGIQRYKKAIHGMGLPENAIIGYIQDGQNCTHWQQKINNWIKELISSNKETDIHWDSNDYLTQAGDFQTTQKYTSKNTRIVDSITDSIRLYHYLVELS